MNSKNDDHVIASGVSDTVTSSAGAATMQLNGSADSAVIQGSGGLRAVTINGAHDVITSATGSGNEQINVSGSAVAATIVERDQIGANYGADTIKLPGIAANQALTFNTATKELTLTDSASGQQVNVVNPFGINSNTKNISFTFGDGTTLKLADLLKANGVHTLANGIGTSVSQAGLVYNSTIDFSGSNDSLNPNAGNDSIAMTGSNSILNLTYGNYDVIEGGSHNLVTTGAGTASVSLSGVNGVLDVQGGVGVTNVNVTGNHEVVGSELGSGDEFITVPQFQFRPSR